MSTPLRIPLQQPILQGRNFFSFLFFKLLTAAIFLLCSINTAFAQDVDLELSLTSNDATPALYQTVRVTYRLSNTGTAAANDIAIKVGVCNTTVNEIDAFNQNNQIVNGSPGPSASIGNYSIANRTWSIPQLAAGTSATLELSLFILSTNEKTLLGQVISVNETDIDSSPLNLNACTPVEDDEASFILNDDGMVTVLPNITVSNVAFDNSQTYRPGDDLSLTYDILIQDEDVPATETRIYLFNQVNGGIQQIVELGTVTMPAMVAGNFETISQTFTIPTDAEVSDYRLVVRVDNAEEVTESQEFDNQASPPAIDGVQPLVFIDYPELEITNVTCPDEYPQRGGGATVNYEITLQNNGSQPTFATNLYHYQSEPDRNPFPLPVLGEVEIPALTVGEEVTLTLIANLVTEFPGYNNSGEVAYDDLFFSLNPYPVLTGEGYRLFNQDVFCEKYNTDIELSLSADDLTFGFDEIIDYTITITNNGSETAYNLFTDIDAFLPIGTLENSSTSINSEVYRFYDIGGNPTFHYYIPVLEVGESATADITFKVFRLDTPGQLTETVELTVYSGHLIDSDESNNTDSITFDFDDGNNNCSITATIENIQCDDFQGNPIVTADVTVNGMGNVSSNGYLIPLEGGGSTSGTYGETRPLNLDADYVQDALNGEFAITVVDTDDPTCRVDVSAPAPDCTGGTACMLTATIENMRCTEVLGNPLVTAEVTINATGTVSVNGYTLTVNGDDTNSQTANYGQTITVSILNTLVQNVLDGNFAFDIEDLDNANCGMSFSEPAMDCGPNEDPMIDLEIELTSDASLVWGNFRQFYVERTLRNLGPDDANNIDMTSSVQAGGGGFISFLPAGTDFEGRTLFDISILDDNTFYAQVNSADEQDIDSTPGNGICCTPNEDDEAVLVFPPCNLTATAELVDCIPGAGFGTDELIFNITVSGSTDNGWHAWRGEGGIFLDRPEDGSFLHTIIRAELGTPTYIQDNINPLCEYQIDFPNITEECENTGGGNVDLALSLSTTDPNPNLFTSVPMTYTLTNTSVNTASDIKVYLSICNPEENRPRLFFNEYGIVNSSTPAELSVGTYNSTTQTWSVPQLAAGESETITIYLFILTNEPRTILGEVFQVTENDVDSSPANLLTCAPSEDDEASFTLNEAVGNCAGLVEISTQSGLSIFTDCTTWDGTIFINGPDITDLSPMSNLQVVTGDLHFRDNINLQNLDGLESLQTVGGDDTSFNGLFIINNNQLQNIDGLSSLQTVNGELSIGSNDALTDLDGLASLNTVEGLQILNLESLVNLDGLSFLQNTNGIEIRELPLITQIDAFFNITTLFSVSITDNNNLQNVDGLINLQQASLLTVADNPALANCCGIFPILSNNGVSQQAFVENNLSCDSVQDVLDDCDNNNTCEITNVLIQSTCVPGFPGSEDDIVTLEIKPEGTNLGTTYTVNGPNVDNEVYTYGDFAVLHGYDANLDEDLTFTITDNDNLNCTTTFTFNPRTAWFNCVNFPLPDFAFANPTIIEFPPMSNSEGVSDGSVINVNSTFDIVSHVVTGEIFVFPSTFDFSVKTYLSTDNVIDANDIVLLENPRSYTFTSPLPSGLIEEGGLGGFNLPTNTADGDYFIIIKYDADDEIEEADETNNTVSYSVQVEGGNMGNGVDLELSVNASNPNPTIFTKTTLTYTLTNTGAETAINSTVRVGLCSVENGGFTNEFGFINANGVVYSSPAPSVSTGSYNQVSQIWTIPQLAAGETATLDVTVFMLTNEERIVLGEVQTMGEADTDSTPGNLSTCTINEDDEARLVLNGDAIELLPDLQLANLNSIATGEAGEVVDYVVDIVNTGDAMATGDFEIGAYLSTDNQFHPTDVLIGGIGTGNAPVGTQSNILGSVTVPLGAIPGDYFLILLIDKDEEIEESNENNNTISIPFTVEDGGCICTDEYDPVCGSNGVTYGNACEAECVGIFDYTPGECPISDGVDLELEILAPASYNIYTNVIFQARLTNNGTINAENVEVDFPLPDGFVHSSSSASIGAYDLFREQWEVGTVKVGETAVLDLNLFALISGNVTVYAQVSVANPDDVDSTPGNGTCCTPNEDDEAAITIGSSLQNGNGTTAYVAPSQHRNIVIKALYPNIATDEVTIFVQSKLPELNARVYNMQGHEVMQQKYLETEGFRRLELNVSELPTGTYLFRFEGSLGQETVRFVKMRM